MRNSHAILVKELFSKIKDPITWVEIQSYILDHLHQQSYCVDTILKRCFPFEKNLEELTLEQEHQLCQLIQQEVEYLSRTEATKGKKFSAAIRHDVLVLLDQQRNWEQEYLNHNLSSLSQEQDLLALNKINVEMRGLLQELNKGEYNTQQDYQLFQRKLGEEKAKIWHLVQNIKKSSDSNDLH